MHFVQSSWNDPTVGSQNIGSTLNGTLETTRLLFKSRKKKVTEAEVLEFATIKSVVHKLSHKLVLCRKRDKASHHIPRRQDPKLVTQNPRRAAAVRHCDNSGQIKIIFFETREHGKSAGTAAYYYHFRFTHLF